MAAFERVINARLGAVSGPERGVRLAARAVAERDRVLAEAKPAVPVITTFVDGRAGAPLETARDVILFRFAYQAEAVDAAITMLVQTAPYSPDHHNNLPYYRDDFALFVNDEEVPIDSVIPPNATVTITNLIAFARKIEKGSSIQAPDGVFQQVARLLKQRFGNSMDIRFGYLPFPGQGPAGPASRRGGKRSRGQDDSFPSIVIAPRRG